MNSFPIMFACNDERGHFQGWFQDVHIGPLTLEGPRTVVRVPADQVLRVGRVEARLYGYREWVGNWCWNSYELATADGLAKVLNYLNVYRNFRVTSGPVESRVRDKIERGLSLVNYADVTELLRAE